MPNFESKLLLAAQKGNDYDVQELLKTESININYQTVVGWTPLLTASDYCHLTIVQLLLSQPEQIRMVPFKYCRISWAIRNCSITRSTTEHTDQHQRQCRTNSPNPCGNTRAYRSCGAFIKTTRHWHQLPRQLSYDSNWLCDALWIYKHC